MWGLVLALPLVGGYFFVYYHHHLKLISAREDGHRLYFRSAFFGVLLFLLSVLLNLIVYWKFEFLEDVYCGKFLPSLFVSSNANDQSGFSSCGASFLVSTAIFSVFLGPLVAKLLNQSKRIRDKFYLRAWFCIKCAKDRAKEKENRMEKYILHSRENDRNLVRDNELELLILDSMTRRIPILLTMRNGKYYVGNTLHSSSPAVERRYLKILPFFTGVRDQKTQELIEVTNYKKMFRWLKVKPHLDQLENLVGNREELLRFILEEKIIVEGVDLKSNEIDGVINELQKIKALSENDYIIVVPYEEIVSAHLFDLSAYKVFKKLGVARKN